MIRGNRLRFVHIASTTWFIFSAGYLLVLTLHQAGESYWVILTLSGYSTLVALMLISLYLFAIFRGVARSQKIQVEHPLTNTSYYMAFYVSTPFLGGLAGMLGMIGEIRVSQLLAGVAIGSLWATFFVWIVIDPAVGLLELLLPASRRHRLERLAKVRAWREKREKERKRLLAEADEQEKIYRRRWHQLLNSEAEKLAELLSQGQASYKEAEDEAVGIGVRAWQIGGLDCMRELHSMTMDLCKTQYRDSTIVDHISFWWDGIGSWHSPSIV
jgi:hypothetical protein